MVGYDSLLQRRLDLDLENFCGTVFFVWRLRKQKNNNEGFDYLHIMLLIHVYALAKIHQVK